MLRRTGWPCLALILGTLVLIASTSAALIGASGTVEQQPQIGVDCDPSRLSGPLKVLCLAKRFEEGRRLFEEETFGGNGRTCDTCHSARTGTFSPKDAQRRLARNPADPLFLHDGLDDGIQGTSRITEHATVRIEIPLTSRVRLFNDPLATSVVFLRGTPTTINTPALQPVFMYDGRDTTLETQALGAVHAHAQNGVEPTALQLQLIADFQRTAPRFFSSLELFAFARGGAPPQLPLGRTASEKRGRAMFDNVPFDGVTTRGLCNTCHSGPMLNRFGPGNPFGGPPGGRRAGIGINERNLIGNPLYTFIVTNPDGTVVVVTTPDPGAMLNDPPPSAPPGVPTPPRSFFANLFKIPTLWGVKDTAPYFHDNSAKTLEDVAEHYAFFFLTSPSTRGFIFTEQDQADMVAFLKLLR